MVVLISDLLPRCPSSMDRINDSKFRHCDIRTVDSDGRATKKFHPVVHLTIVKPRFWFPHLTMASSDQFADFLSTFGEQDPDAFTNGVLRLSALRDSVNLAMININPGDMNNWAWRQVFHVVASYYLTSRRDRETEVAMRLLRYIGMGHINLRGDSFEQVLTDLGMRQSEEETDSPMPKQGPDPGKDDEIVVIDDDMPDDERDKDIEVSQSSKVLPSPPTRLQLGVSLLIAAMRLDPRIREILRISPVAQQLAGLTTQPLPGLEPDKTTPDVTMNPNLGSPGSGPAQSGDVPATAAPSPTQSQSNQQQQAMPPAQGSSSRPSTDHKKKVRDAQKSRAFYAANKDRLRAKAKVYRDANRDSLRKKRKEWEEANKDKMREYRKKYHKEHRDEINAAQRKKRAELKKKKLLAEEKARQEEEEKEKAKQKEEDEKECTASPTPSSPLSSPPSHLSSPGWPPASSPSPSPSALQPPLQLPLPPLPPPRIISRRASMDDSTIPIDQGADGLDIHRRRRGSV